MAEIKLRLFEFADIHDSLIDSVKTLIDPKTIPDPEDPDANPATILFGENVRKSRPTKISLYGTTMAVATLDEVISIKPQQMGGGKVAVVTGGLQVWIKGRNDDSERKCKHYCDVAGAYFQNKNLLNNPKVTIKPTDRDNYKWANINLAGPGKPPVFYTLGYVGFLLRILKSNTAYVIS